jgi:DnaK suppressor protein
MTKAKSDKKPKLTAKKTTKATKAKKVTKKVVAKKVVKKPATKKVIKKIVAKNPVKKVVAKKKVVSLKKAKTIKKPAAYKPKAKEKYMSAPMKRYFNQILVNWREDLREEMQKTFEHLKDKGEKPADDLDRASQEEEFAFELRTRDRERKLINKIASAIELIKQDDYGYCESCGVNIGIKRLEARPTATHCIDCKTLDEIKEKQLSG